MIPDSWAWPVWSSAFLLPWTALWLAFPWYRRVMLRVSLRQREASRETLGAFRRQPRVAPGAGTLVVERAELGTRRHGR